MAVEQTGVQEPTNSKVLPAVPNDELNPPIEDREFLAKRKEDAMALARLIYDIFQEEKDSQNRGEYDTIEEQTT